ncbi:hypothetical protein DSO57_1015135 [Entomophthora muscae]|uniref:Uncharacterized protein n=1 Tax=Entomophthora muscae TaxID=34485 RepID=A0ACC2UF10_9FUNG|nr:hypothetical protein DSO57_1015135 [Entomophthora muscae]
MGWEIYFMSGRRGRKGARDRGSRTHTTSELGVSELRRSLPSYNPGEEPRIKITMRGLRGRGRYRGSRGGRRRRGAGDFGRGKFDDDFVDVIEDEDFVEEHVIVRAPPSMADEIRTMIRDKERIQDISLTFTDPRKGIFKIKDQEIGMKLVDMPTIIESQKFYHNKNMIKVADISQMLVLDDPENKPSRPAKNRDSVSWPDGLSLPLKDVRRRRFRKRVSKQIIEIVENELERLLLKDLQALDVQYEFADAPDREDYDSDAEIESAAQDPTGEEAESQAGQDTPKATEELITEADLVVSSENEALDLDELERAVEIRDMDDANEADEEGMEEEDEEEDGDSDDSESEIDEEAMEQKTALKEAIAELESNLEKKRADLAVATNPIIKKRFEDVIAKLKLELDIKEAQLEAFDQ